MDFTELMKSMQSRVCASPGKWSYSEVANALDTCKTINDVNQVIRFCPYDEDIEAQLVKFEFVRRYLDKWSLGLW